MGVVLRCWLLDLDLRRGVLRPDPGAVVKLLDSLFGVCGGLANSELSYWQEHIKKVLVPAATMVSRGRFS